MAATLPRPPESEAVAYPQTQTRPNPAGGMQQGGAPMADVMPSAKIAASTLPRPPDDEIFDWAEYLKEATDKEQLVKLLPLAAEQGRPFTEQMLLSLPGDSLGRLLSLLG